MPKKAILFSESRQKVQETRICINNWLNTSDTSTSAQLLIGVRIIFYVLRIIPVHVGRECFLFLLTLSGLDGFPLRLLQDMRILCLLPPFQELEQEYHSPSLALFQIGLPIPQQLLQEHAS